MLGAAILHGAPKFIQTVLGAEIRRLKKTISEGMPVAADIIQMSLRKVKDVLFYIPWAGSGYDQKICMNRNIQYFPKKVG